MLRKNNILSGIFTILVVLLLNACVVVVEDSDATINPHGSAFSEYWYYYPNEQVYYHAHEHYYYYPVGGNWKRANQLPSDRAIVSKHRVLLKVAGLPYRQHAYHHKQYPARNVAVNQTGKGNHAGGVNHPYSGNAGSADAASDYYAGEHSNPAKPEHATRGYAYGKQQAPGQTEVDRSVQAGNARTDNQASPGHTSRDQRLAYGHSKSRYAYGKSRQAFEHANNELLINEQPGLANHGTGDGLAVTRQSVPDSIEHEKGTKPVSRQAKSPEHTLPDNKYGVRGNSDGTPNRLVVEVTRRDRSQKHEYKQNIKGDGARLNRVSEAGDGPQQSTSAVKRNANAAKSNQASQSGRGVKKSSQTGSDTEGGVSESESGMESSEDKMVKLRMNSGNQK